MIYRSRQHLLLPWIPLTAALLLVVWSSSILAEPVEEAGDLEAAVNVSMSMKRNLTGNPQIDYVHDPNLPRELNGYNLSSYPFYTRVPAKINFSCKGYKDGFYANVEHKCQIYHSCLGDTRYDFLCANYTAFDQSTFICQFVSEVDCENSHLYHHRNIGLYLTPTTTTVAPLHVPIGGGRRIRPAIRDYDSGPETDYPAERNRNRDPPKDSPGSGLDRLPGRRRNRRRCAPGRRGRRCRNRRPRPDYDDYDDYDDYYESDRRGSRNRDRDRSEYDYEDYETEGKGKKKPGAEEPEKPAAAEPSPATAPAPKPKSIRERLVAPEQPPPAPDDTPLDPVAIAANREKLFTKSRAPPKIRPPVPTKEKRKYHRPAEAQPSTTKAPPKAVSAEAAEYDEYYDEESYEQPVTTQRRENAYLPTRPPPTTSTTTTTTTTTAPPPPPEYDYEYEDYEAEAVVVTQRPTTTTTTTTTNRPLRGFGPRRSQSRLSVSIPEVAETSPGEEHQKINEALETPSRPSFRQPYHNRPRPDFVRNSQMLQPITTLRTTTSTTSTSERPAPTFIPGNSYDGMNRRFPAFDDSRVETTTVGQRNSRFRGRQPVRTTTSTTPETLGTEYGDFEPTMPERYGQKSAGSYQHQQQAEDDYSSIRQSPFQTQPQHPEQEYQEVPPTIPSYQVFRPRHQSNFVTPFATSGPRTTSSSRPEFISLLSDDDDGTYGLGQERQAPPAARFRHQARPLLAAAQELYPAYAAPQYGRPDLGPYVKSVRPRSVYNHMYLPPYKYVGY